MAVQVIKMPAAKTLNGASVTFTVHGANIKVNDANVIKTDIAATNGTIHVIDSVLLPK